MKIRDLPELLARAAKPTFDAIESDEKRAPPAIRPLFSSMRKKLFDLDAGLDEIRHDADLRDESSWKLFRDAVGQPAGAYLRNARNEVVARLLTREAQPVGVASFLVGYSSVPSFRRAVREFLGEPASRFQRRAQQRLERAGPPPRGVDSQEHWEDMFEGKLIDDEARDLDAYVDALYPAAPAVGAARPWQGLRDEAWARVHAEIAEALVDSLDRLPWPDQRRLARDAVFFPDAAFFDALSRRARESGPHDPARGVELSLLAIDSLASNELSSNTSSLAPLAWSRLGLARWRAGDPAAAEEAFEQSAQDFERVSKKFFRTPAAAEHSRVTAAFHWFRRREEEARELAEESVRQHRAWRSENLGKALLLRAELRAAGGELRGAFDDLDEVHAVLQASGGEPPPCMDLLPRVLVLLGDRGDPAGVLEQKPGGSVTRPMLRWYEGHCRPGKAERLWREARDGFAESGEDLWVARTTLDLIGLCLAEEREKDARGLASELLTTLGTVAESSESLAAVETLRRAVALGKLGSGVLEEVDGALARLEWGRRGRRALWFAE